MERKLSLQGEGPDKRGNMPPEPLRKIIDAACAMGNSNPGRPCYIVFGQHDSGTFVGQVTPDFRPLSSKEVDAGKKRVAARLGKCGIAVRWYGH